MHNTILPLLMLSLLPATASAQFYTITRESGLTPESYRKSAQIATKENNTFNNSVQDVNKDTLSINTLTKQEKSGKDQKSNKKTSPKSELPELTIPNLYAEIMRNGIRHPKIVLAQAILETGWFTSPVCRNKHNLFGLTNPKTGKYFEFDHWTESVRAYYTKVQYKFKGGDYLLWLRKIGYAEAPNYIHSIISILRML